MLVRRLAILVCCGLSASWLIVGGVFVLADELASNPVDSAAVDRMVRVINQETADHWEQVEIKPQAVCSDRAFVRRVYLDVIGRVPTVEEATAFLKGKGDDRREQLIDELLGRPQHAIHMADVLDAALMDRTNPDKYHARRDNGWRDYLATALAKNVPWHEVAREILLARPERKEARNATWFLYERQNKYQEIAEAIAPAFFGIRIECAQCHDHPLADEIKQAHYWGLVAFYRRGTNVNTKAGPRIKEAAVGGFEEFADLTGDSNPNLLAFLDAMTVAEKRPQAGEKVADEPSLYQQNNVEHAPRLPKFSRRRAFVDHVLTNHPRVPRAFVNRMWAWFLGRGIVHPHDQMDSMHSPSHPQLLERLAKEFVTSNHNVRTLIKALLLSKPYQLKSQPAEGAKPADFAHYLDRSLTLEQLVRSWQVVTQDKTELDRDVVYKALSVFPDVMPENETTGIKQTLFLSNNPELHKYFEGRSQQRIESLRAMDNDETRAKTLVQLVFGRPAEADEVEAIVNYLKSHNPPQKALQQILWAMVTSAEFRFNH